MNLLRSFLTSLFISIALIASSILVFAAEITIPSYGQFGDATITGDIFEYQSGGPNGYGGFAATNEGGGEPYYPFIFSADGQITVNAAVPSGGSATLLFVFEYQAWPNTTPNYEVTIPISGSTLDTYTATVPSQGANTFSNFVVYVVEQDTPVQIQDITVAYDDPIVDPNAPTPGGASETTIPVEYWTPFDGSGTTIANGNEFTFPTGAQTWAGFAVGGAGYESSGENIYPFSFAEAGEINFTASVPDGTSAEVRFVFEYQPYPNVTPNYNTETVTISGATPTSYQITVPSQGSNTFSSFLFYVVTQDKIVVLGDVVITDDAGGSGSTGTTGVRFVFEEIPGDVEKYVYETETVEVTSTTPEAFSISIPVYENPLDTFENMLLYAVGEDQSIKVADVTLIVNGATYGGSGADSLLFNNIFGGVDVDESSFTYTFLSTSASWGGFALSNSQIDAWPAGGILLNNGATLTFTANLVDTPVDLPPEYNGETAFSDGVIDTSEDTGTGRDDEPAYKWSAYVAWFTLEAGDTQGTYAGGDNWGQLSDLPATWNNGVITLAPNTASYSSWNNEPDEADGEFFLEQTLKIEGTQGTSEILGKTVNFSGTVDSYTLDARYTVTAFVKALDPANNYSPIVIEQVELSAAGNFAISADLPSGDYIPQLGFLLTGRNANPDTDWGNIQISNVAGSYDETTAIRDGNFTDGANAYWGFTNSGVGFNTDGGNGSVPGQVVMTNGTTNRANVYIVTNGGNLEPLANFGMEAGNTYEVTYYMNRASGSDLGLIQFEFDTGAFIPADFSANIHGDANPASNTWVQYTQTVEVPASATQALFYVISGANSVIAFDQINVTEVANNFASWATDNGLSGADAAFSADPDGDGIPNGLESFLGTLPGSSSAAMSNIAKTTNGISMSHSRNSDLASDITASYQWSTDLSTWSASGETVNGTTVTITTDDSVPGTTTATATVSGTEADNVFIKVNVSND
ncbi:MAG: hypothetical protein O2827_02110 [Verrucomicrobia bacterium]|nr:hypothetical protein [Verrucomicrobiota bacterium]